MGARPYRYLNDYKPARGCLIEIGSERGEGSTAFLAEYAKKHHRPFFTTDIDPESHEAAKVITRGARLMSGSLFLQRFRGRISVAYMDGFDWIPEGLENEAWIHEQQARYASLGVEMTNEHCQAEHLREAVLIAKKAADRCCVILDDTWSEDGGWSGKGGLAVPHLESEGFAVVETEGPEKDSLGYAVMTRD
jgi:hypothetical protein